MRQRKFKVPSTIVLSYIHNNPVVNGIVQKAEDYIYSSAKNYCGEEGLFKINKF